MTADCTAGTPVLARRRVSPSHDLADVPLSADGYARGEPPRSRKKDDELTQLLRSPWNAHFDDLLTEASSSLVLCAPFVGRGPCGRVQARIAELASAEFQVTVVTDLSRDNMLSGVTDVFALAEMAKASPTVAIRFLPSLHAKVYVADDKRAIVTAAARASEAVAYLKRRAAS